MQGVVELNLFDVFGNVVKKKTVQLHKGISQEILDNLGTLPDGLYILRTLFNGNIIQTKLVRSH
jgi:hypothetical protein